MESLPYEIIESIADYLDTRDFDACLTVCKLWSVLFMKNVYTDIHIKSEFKLMLFLESLVIYPRCMDAGQYIKSLDMSSLTTADKFRKNSQVDIHATDALIHCLNIERLTLPAHADIIKTFLDPKMPEFTHLKYLHFRVVSNYTTTEILDCYYKYRSSLVYMNLKGLSRVFIKFTFDDIVNYLSSFGLLEELHIDLPIPHFQLNHTLNDIFDHCQRLNKVEYGAYMMNTPIHYYRRVKVYEPLAYLELNLIDFYLQDSFYIKSRFTQLETLSLIIDHRIYAESKVINVLMSLKTLVNLKIKISNSYSKNIVNTFWEHATQSSTTHRQSNNKAEFWFNVYGDHSMTISFIKCPKTGTRTMVSKVYIPRGTILPYDEYLAGMGQCIDELEMRDNSPEVPVNLQLINHLCPSLTKLTLHYANIITGTVPLFPNPNLIILTLEYCIFSVSQLTTNQTVFKAIELAYPKLQKLYLDEPCFEENGTKEDIYRLQLPETGLQFISITKNFWVFEPWNIMIIKEKNGVPLWSWHYDEKTEKTIVTEKKDTTDQWPFKSLFVLKSSTLNKVHFSPNKNYFY